MDARSRVRQMLQQRRERVAALTAEPPYDPDLAVQTAAPEVATTNTDRFDRAVPWGLQVAAAWSWRLLAIGALTYLLGFGLRYFSAVAVPLSVAILLAAMLAPVSRRLQSWGLPVAAAAGVAVVGGFLIILATLTLVTYLIVDQAGELGANVASGFQQAIAILQGPPFNVDRGTLQLERLQARFTDLVRGSASTIAGYAGQIGSGVGNFLAGLALALFALFYMLYDGRRIWSFLLLFVPRPARARVDSASRLGWRSLSAYVRATVIVAAVDAIGVLVAALILGVPLAGPIAVLTFLTAFIPIVGALLSGLVAVLVALVALGWVKALIMLGAVILVMQLESNVLQPFLLGRAVNLHPLAVLLGIAIGIVVAGIVGALLVIPVLAFGKDFVRGLSRPPHEVVAVS